MLRASSRALLLVALLVGGDAMGQVSVTRTPVSVVPVPGGTADFGSISLEVRQFTLLSMSPPLIVLNQIGQTQQVTVLSVLSDRSGYDVTSSLFMTTYTVTNPAIATVSPAGLVTAVSSGTTVLQAFSNGETARSVIVVNPSA